MNDFLLASVAVICADTPKSAFERKRNSGWENYDNNKKVSENKIKEIPQGREKRTNGDGAGLSHRVWRSRCLSRGCWRPVGRQIACRLWLNVRRFVRLGGIVTEFSCFCASHAQELHKRASQYVYRHPKKTKNDCNKSFETNTFGLALVYCDIQFTKWKEAWRGGWEGGGSRKSIHTTSTKRGLYYKGYIWKENVFKKWQEEYRASVLDWDMTMMQRAYCKSHN